MIPFLLAVPKLLSPKLWAVVGVGLLLGVVGVQTLRLNHAKGDLTQARAALRDPVSGRKWQALAEENIRDLKTCRSSNVALTEANAAEMARLSALQADAEARLRQTSAELSKAATGRAAAEARAAKLLAHPPMGVDACSRTESAFEAAKEALR